MEMGSNSIERDRELLNTQNQIYATLDILVNFSQNIKDRKWSLAERTEFDALLQNLIRLKKQLDDLEDIN